MPLLRLAVTLVLVIGWWSVIPLASVAAAGWAAPLPEPITVTRPFDPPDNPFGAGHRGVDLASSPDQSVRAAGAGTVVFAGPLAGRGVVSIEHADGLRTTYEPVGAAVSAGESVSLGQAIGTLGSGHPGCPVLACLHWGLKRGEVYLDPLLLLRRGPVRLLPRYGASAADAGLALAQAMTAGPLGLGFAGLVPLALWRRRASRKEGASQVSDLAAAIRRVDGPADRPP